MCASRFSCFGQKSDRAARAIIFKLLFRHIRTLPPDTGAVDKAGQALTVRRLRATVQAPTRFTPPEAMTQAQERPATTQALAPVPPTQAQMEVAEMHRLAALHGFACQPFKDHSKSFALEVAARLKPRRAAELYQVASFSLKGFPRSAAENLFSHVNPRVQTEKEITWEADTVEEVAAMMSDLFDRFVPHGAGLTKAIRPPSESAVSVVATLCPPFVCSCVKMPRGVMLYVNYLYVLATDQGVIHPPKDSQRREIALMPNLLTALRVRVMQDVLSLSQRYEPLTSAFWQQLGMPARAAAVAAGGGPAMPRPPRERTALPQFERYEIECVLETEHLRGGWWVRVRWAGYDPSWEAWRLSGVVGSPIETWEPLRLVCRTQAWHDWQEAATQE